MENKEKSPIKDLIEALRKDHGYYDSWKANIAMAFHDEYCRSFRQMGIRDISNVAAENFLKLLMSYEKS